MRDLTILVGKASNPNSSVPPIPPNSLDFYFYFSSSKVHGPPSESFRTYTKI